MQILLTGGTGFIGEKMLMHFLAAGHAVTSLVRRTGRFFGEIQRDFGPKFREIGLPSNPKSSLFWRQLQDEEFDCIIHLAALSSRELCELNPELAKESNVEFTQSLVSLAQRIGSFFVFASTDMVFDGYPDLPCEGKWFSEDDVPRPVSAYSRTKLQAEECVQTIDSSVILRIALTYGKPGSFSLGSLGNWIKMVKNGEKLTAYSDEFRTPIWVEDLLKATRYIAENRISGTYHAAGTERISRSEMALLLAKGLQLEPQVVTVMQRPPERPSDLSLDSTNLWQTCGFSPHSFVEGLAFLKAL